ncbi:MAG: family 16 glycoside hydrolase [Candidatus Hydrogenedentota bacterium]
MKHVKMLLSVLAILLAGSGAIAAETNTVSEDEAKPEKTKTIRLFNGEDLEGWHMYVEDPDVDPKIVWEVRDGALWCKGTPNGFIRTKKQYGDFKLVLEWRWPEEPGNSGVLVRMTDEEKIWPLCMEAQLKHERAGDVVGMGCDFNENTRPPGEFFRVAERKNPSNEKKPGEWNKYKIVCKGDTLTLTVNGEVQNKATGMQVPEKGYIGLQSEGAPILFRNIKLTPLR